MTVAGLVLAAGAGRRLGRPKALVDWDGELLARRAVRLLDEGGCEPVHVVVGADADRLPALPDAVPVVNPRWRQGLGSSLLRGLDSLPAAAEAVVVVLVDQPWLTPDAVRRVRAAYTAGAAVAVAVYAGQPGHPVLLSRATWPLLAPYATGDRGARDFLRARADLVIRVPCDGSPADVDTRADLAQAKARLLQMNAHTCDLHHPQPVPWGVRGAPGAERCAEVADGLRHDELLGRPGLATAKRAAQPWGGAPRHVQ